MGVGSMSQLGNMNQQAAEASLDPRTSVSAATEASAANRGTDTNRSIGMACGVAASPMVEDRGVTTHADATLVLAL